MQQDKNDDIRLLAYNITFSQYSIAQEVPREELCNGFIVTNIGDTTAKVNGKVLFPSTTPATVQGDSITIGGNQGEIYKGQIILSFVQPVGAAPLVEIIQKYYIQIKK